jgi:hypothetical protein
MEAIFEIILNICLGILILAGYIALALLFCSIGLLYGFGIAIVNYSKAFSVNVYLEK